jgi:hypothetical protein
VTQLPCCNAVGNEAWKVEGGALHGSDYGGSVATRAPSRVKKWLHLASTAEEATGGEGCEEAVESKRKGAGQRSQ